MPERHHVYRAPEPMFLTLPETAELLRFTATCPKDPLEACRAWLRRHRIPVVKRGRILLIERELLLAALRNL